MSQVIFVFGSNEAGKHGAGSAAHAYAYWGAVWGQGKGRHGDSYALPTKDIGLRPLALGAIRRHVDVFMDYAWKRQDLTFHIVEVGCGLAGYEAAQIAPLFAQSPPKNCEFSPRFAAILQGGMSMHSDALVDGWKKWSAQR